MVISCVSPVSHPLPISRFRRGFIFLDGAIGWYSRSDWELKDGGMLALLGGLLDLTYLWIEEYQESQLGLYSSLGEITSLWGLGCSLLQHL